LEKYLLKHGWLIDTGQTAAQKFAATGRPVTRGAHAIKVYRVDDPTDKSHRDKSSGGNLSVGKELAQGSYSGSGSVSDFDFASRSSSRSLPTNLLTPTASREVKSEDKSKTQPNQNKTGNR
jgi:hypothetical protein